MDSASPCAGKSLLIGMPRAEATQHRVSIYADLARNLPSVADRVQGPGASPAGAYACAFWIDRTVPSLKDRPKLDLLSGPLHGALCIENRQQQGRRWGWRYRMLEDNLLCCQIFSVEILVRVIIGSQSRTL
jgi:hypothetical protein